jgi:hypothetical protein
MTATNHVVTGMVIGTVVANPVIAFPLALLSHFILDALPHYGESDHHSKKFKMILLADMMVAAIALIMVLLITQNWVVILAGIFAASPDLMWLPLWLKELRGQTTTLGPIAKLHKQIQWSEKSSGALYEAAWFLAIGALLIVLIG